MSPERSQGAFSNLSPFTERSGGFPQVAQKYLEYFGALNETIQAIARESDIDNILRIVVDKGFTLVNATRGLICIATSDKKNLVVKSYRCPESVAPVISTGYRLPVTQGIVGRVFRTGKPILVRDLEKEKKWQKVYFEVFKETRAELAVPIIGRRKTWGVINVESPLYGAFDVSHERILSMLATHTSIALENADVRKKQAMRLSAFSRTFAAMSLRQSIEDILQCVSEQAVRGVGGHVASIKLYNERNATLEPKVTSPANYLAKLKRMSFKYKVDVCKGGPDDSISAKVFRHQRSMLTPDVRREPLWRRIGWRVRSAIHVPISAENRPLGVLAVDSFDTNAFTNDDLDCLMVLAEQAAFAIEADWHNKLVEKGSAVLPKVLSFLKSESQIQRQARILGGLGNIVWDIMPSKGFCFLMRGEDDPLLLRIPPDCDFGIERTKPVELRVGRGIAGRTVLTGKVHTSKDVKSDKDYGDPKLAKQAKLASLLSLPIVTQGITIGALNYYTSIKRDFSKFEIHTLRSLCSIAGLALSVTETAARHWEQIVERAPVGIILTDAHGNIEYVNETWEELAGGNAVGRNLLELRSIKDAHLVKPVRRALRGEIVELPKGRFTTEFGESLVLSCKCVPMVDNSGRVSSLLVSCWDLTALAEQHDALIRQNESIALGNLAAGMTHEAMSPLRAAQYGLEQTVGELPRLLRLEGEVAKILSRAKGQSKAKATLKRIRYLVAHGGPPPHNPTDAEIKDVRRILKRHRIASRTQEERRLATSGLTQHLDTLLSCQGGKYAERLFSYLVSLAGVVGACRDAHYSMFKLEDIVSALHKHAFISEDDWKEADIHETIDGALLILRPRIAKFDITVRTSYSCYVPKIKCVPGQLTQVWRNLLQNSVDALQKAKGPRSILVKTMKRTRNVVVQIDDNGRGPPRGVDLQASVRVLPEIDKGPPRGYGLWLVSQIVEEKHGGKFRITIGPEKGVSVKVILPIHATD